MRPGAIGGGRAKVIDGGRPDQMPLLALALVLASLLPAPAVAVRASTQPTGTAPGVVVESVGPSWSGASRAGLREGDTIVAWSVPGASAASVRPVVSLHDWMEAEAEHSLRRDGVRVTFRRDGAERTTDLGGGAWLLDVRPMLDGELAAAHAAALVLSSTGDHARAAAAWRDLAVRQRGRDAAVAAWFALRAGAAALSAGDKAAADAAYADARAWAGEAALVWLQRAALEGLGRARQGAETPGAAAEAWTAAVTLLREARPTSPSTCGR